MADLFMVDLVRTDERKQSIGYDECEWDPVRHVGLKDAVSRK